MSTESRTPQPQLLRKGLKSLFALATVASLFFSGCSSQNTASVDASHVLQSVTVDLTSSSEVAHIGSTLISFDATNGASSSEDVDYSVRDTVNGLPVRVTARYTTNDKSGSDLKDLEGFTGPISIDITVENLTVRPEEVTYDVAGVQKKKSALVGAPLSVAASTTLPGVSPQDVLSEVTVGQGKTNGVISTNKDGDTVLQWGKILAGPEGDASTTFTMNISAKDFKVPKFTVAVQPGLSSDLSTAGAVSSTFSEAQNSELKLMQQTVELITQTNQALADAGATISAVRDNLKASSDSLKSSTIRELQQSSDRLTGQLADLQDKLGSLKTNLGESAQGSQSELLSQMQQTIDSFESLLGRAGEEIPAPEFNAGTCQVNIVQPAGGSTVYSNMVQLSQVLGAFSEANVDCRDQVLQTFDSLLGPENPSAENCKDSVAASCAVYNSQAVLTANLLASASQTQKLVEQLNPGPLSKVTSDYATASQALDSVQKQVDALSVSEVSPQPIGPTNPPVVPKPEPTETAKPLDATGILASLDRIDEKMKSSQEDLDGLKGLLDNIHKTAQLALTELSGDSANHRGSMLSQNQELADQLCQLADGGKAQAGKLSQKDIDRLRAYLTNVPCDAQNATPSPTASSVSPSPSASSQEGSSDKASPVDVASSLATVASHTEQADASKILLTVPDKFPAPLDQRLKNQVDLWTGILTSTDLNNEASDAVGQKLGAIKQNLDGVLAETARLRDTLTPAKPGDPAPTQPAPTQPAPSQPAPTDPKPGDPAPADGSRIKAVKDAMPALSESFDHLSQSLNDLSEQQEKMNEAIKQLAETAPAQNADEINEILGQQARTISDQRAQGQKSINDLFSQQVTSLAGSSNSLSTGAENLLKEQSDQLKAAAQKQVEQADARTQSALERIQASHDQATQDVAGASATLTGELEKIMLDVGDTNVDGSGLLGSLTLNASKAEGADYQLSLATQNAEKYSTLREEDMAAIRFKQAEYKASLSKLVSMPAFEFVAPSGASVNTIYTFTLGGEN